MSRFISASRREGQTSVSFPHLHAASPVVVAIPAKDEADEIGFCLQTLGSQQGAQIDAVVICLNNCADDSASVVRAMTPDLPFAVDAMEVALPPGRGCAGMARRIAMDRAAERAGIGGVLLTIDADGRAAPNWVAANLAALRRGADAVAGQADIDPAGATRIPAHLHAADAEERDYAALLDEIDSLLDPDPADPWPRHDEHSGASIAVTVDAYRRAGGMPPVPLGEDRAFFAALRRIDARIRHAPDVRVTVSARIVGRAPGGMADTIRRRIARMDDFIDDRLEFATASARRASLRARLRTAWRANDTTAATLWFLAAELQLSADQIRRGLNETYFGAAWSDLEDISPRLRRAQVPVDRLQEQRQIATALRDTLRASPRIKPAADRVDTPAYAFVG